MLSNMFVIKTWTFVVLFACLAYGQRKPPNYQQNEMPPTSFSCKDKIVGGYYADPETSCQMFHVCVNVVGTGVQDFRFLCPNDTAFDQENQICDDWYNIDCEAATLYYSDNFDLYKLGSGGAPATTGKATPIPLGPSSASPNVRPQPAKSRKPSLSAPVNNAVSENDDDYYLQRSDSADSRLQHDLLRGSSSGNFFSNRNRGLENPDDYDDGGRVQTSSKDAPKKNAKAPFRKLLTGKKPLVESTTGAASSTSVITTTTTTTAAAAAAATTTVRQPNYKPTTYRSKDRGRVNYKTYLDKQAKADEYDFQKVAKPAAQPTTFAPAVSSSSSSSSSGSGSYQPTAAYQTTQASNVQSFAQANQPRNNDFLRILPNNNNNNNNNNNINNNGFQSGRINVASNRNNNFQANNANNNNFQSNKVFPANNNNNNNNNFQANNAFPANTNNNNNNNNNNNHNFQANNAFQANNNNFQGNNAFLGNNNNFQANNAFPANNNNNNFQANNAFPANNNNNNNNFQGNNAYQPANNGNKNFQQNVNFNQGLQADKAFPNAAQNFNQANFQSEKIHPASTTTQKYVQNPTTNVYQTNSFQQQQQQLGGGNAFQPSNAFQQANAFQPANNAYTQQGPNQFQTAASTTQKYNAYQPPVAFQQSANAFQPSTTFNAATNSFQPQPQTSQQPQFQSTTEHFSKDFKAKFDPYNSYHQRTNEEAGETLKTASSTNLRPSDLNSLIHANKPKSINATLSVGYSFNKADGGVAKSTVVVPAPTTQKPRPFSTQAAVTTVTTPAATSSRAATVASTTAFAAGGTKKTAVNKDKDSTYDYAYYDDSNHNDYTDVVPEDFSRIHNTKN